jgi:hypothetical protein
MLNTHFLFVPLTSFHYYFNYTSKMLRVSLFKTLILPEAAQQITVLFLIIV